MDLSSSGRCVEVLVVDDGASNRRLMKHILEALRCFVGTASSGQQGVLFALTHRYDAVIIDLELTDLDAHVATRQIRSAQQIQGVAPTPIIALGADAPTTDVAEFDAYLTKPATAADIYRALMAVTTSRVIPREDGEVDAAAEFVELARVDVSEMWRALARRDFVVLEREAVRLRGLAQTFGYAAVTSASGSVESLARARSRAEIEDWLAHLGVLLDRAA